MPCTTPYSEFLMHGKYIERILVSFTTINYYPCGIYYDAYLYRDLINANRYVTKRTIFLFIYMCNSFTFMVIRITSIRFYNALKKKDNSKEYIIRKFQTIKYKI